MKCVFVELTFVPYEVIASPLTVEYLTVAMTTESQNLNLVHLPTFRVFAIISQSALAFTWLVMENNGTK